MKIFSACQRVLLLCALVTLPLGRAWAQEEPLSEEEPSSPLEESLISQDILLSEWFASAADGLDMFLVGRRLTFRPNPSSFKIGTSMYSSEAHSITSSVSLGINLRLPNLEEYWHLKFSNYDEQQERRGVRQNYLRETPQEQNYGATVGVFRKLGNIRTAFEPRIELRNPLKVSHSLTFESVADLKTYAINPKIEFYATPDKGTGVFKSLDFNFHLSKAYTLTFINEGEYVDKTHFYYVSNGMVLGQTLNDLMGVSYSLVFGSNNRPSYHLDNYIFAVTWSQLLYRKILDYQLTPHLDFTDDQGFIGRAGVTFTLNLTF